MGAHDLATLAYAQARTERVRDHVLARVGRDAPWAHALASVIDQPATVGRLRPWMQAHHGERIDTLQVGIEPVTERIVSVWAPVDRLVDASRATRVLLDGSSREYAGVITYRANENVYVGFTTWGERVVLLAYRTA